MNDMAWAWFILALGASLLSYIFGRALGEASDDDCVERLLTAARSDEERAVLDTLAQRLEYRRWRESVHWN